MLTFNTQKHTWLHPALLSLALLLAGCGGGGGGTNAPDAGDASRWDEMNWDQGRWS